MSGTKHTPGPWRVYPAGSCVPYYDVCPRVVANEPSGRSVHDAISDADAALIAAAPDLLAALESLTHLCHCAGTGTLLPAYGTTPCRSPQCIAARAAIAKARGGAP